MRDAAYPSVQPLELAAAGQALFGAGWRAELAPRLGVTEHELVLIESGSMNAPAEWRGKLVALAQDVALRALETASDLMWRDDASGESAVASAPPLA